MPKNRKFDDRILVNFKATYALFHEMTDVARILGVSKTQLIVDGLRKTSCHTPPENLVRNPAVRISLTAEEHIVPPTELMEE